MTGPGRTPGGPPPAGAAAELGAELERGLRALALSLPADRRERLLAYLLLLERWSRAYNLTAVREPREMIWRHVVDSLSALGEVRGASVLDVGSGAGLPGLVLAIAEPALRCTLLEPAAKRIRFLVHVVAELGLSHVEVRRGRLEALHPPPRYDTVISRAVMGAERLARGAGPLLRPGGRLVALKGRDPGPEARACAALGWRTRLVPVRLPGLGDRHLLVAEPPPGGAG